MRIQTWAEATLEMLKLSRRLTSTARKALREGVTFDGLLGRNKTASAFGPERDELVAYRSTEHQFHYLIVGLAPDKNVVDVTVTVGEVWCNDRYRAQRTLKLVQLVHLIDNITDAELDEIVHREHKVSHLLKR